MDCDPTDLGQGDPSEHTLAHFNDVVVLGLGMPEAGDYAVFGRVVIVNDDSDMQAASARTTTQDGANLVDRADVRIFRGSFQTLYLQGPAHVQPGQIQMVDIRCRTYAGRASEASLFAIRADALRSD